MAYILRVLIIDPGDKTIKVAHEFYGLTEQECDTYYKEHAGNCEYFHQAIEENRIIEEIEEVDESELPTSADFEMEEID